MAPSSSTSPSSKELQIARSPTPIVTCAPLPWNAPKSTVASIMPGLPIG